MDVDPDNLVEPADGCPVCSERNSDRLVWIDDDRVRCTMCGTEYKPADGNGPVADDE